MTLTTTAEPSVQALLDSPLTAGEKEELQAAELGLELAGKTVLEQYLIIGKHINFIYDRALFRGEGGRTYEQWCEQRLPQLIPGAGGIAWANRRRFLFEAREAISATARDGQPLPDTAGNAELLRAVLPRRYDSTNGWNPLDLTKEQGAAAKVWELAQRNAVQQQRKNGPTREDVTAAREELRPMLIEAGLIREANAGLKAGTAERMAAAAARREVAQRTYDIQPERTEAFDKLMDDIKKTRPERQKAAEVAAVKEELARPERERLQRVEDQIRKYHSKLSNASNAVHDLLVYLRGIDRTDGTEYLMDLRDGDVMGLITVADDLKRIKTMGEELMEAAKLANSCTPASGIDMTTLEVDVV